MKSKISNIYYLILGLLIFGTVSVSAAILLQPDEVSFISDKTSETTVKGALDELYELTKGECPVGHICTTCGVGTYANQETGECTACPNGYTSDSGSGKITDCYIETTAGKYIANANDSIQTTCPVGSYCPSTKIKYGSTGNIVTCPEGYTSAAGATSENQCYIQTTAGKWLSVAKGTTQETCPSGSYCVSTKVYYGNTGGKAICPSIYTSSASGSSSASNCYLTTMAGNYIATAGASSQTTCPAGSYCQSARVYYGGTGSITSCGSDKTSPAGSSSSSACTVTSYTYTKNGDDSWVGTYTCNKSTGIATITGCRYGSVECNGGFTHVSNTYGCTASSGSTGMASGYMHYYCNASYSTVIAVKGGLPSTETCS